MNIDQQNQNSSASEYLERLASLRRIQKVAKILLATGPGDFYGKRESAELARECGDVKLAQKYEVMRQIFHTKFEPIFMEMYRKPLQELPWFIGWNQPCEKQDYIDFAAVHFSTIASKEIASYKNMGLMKGSGLKAEAEMIIAALEFETLSRRVYAANIDEASRQFASVYDFKSAKHFERVLLGKSRPISDMNRSWLQTFFLNFWNNFPRLETGEVVVGANGAILPPLCYFDDKSTYQLVQFFASKSSTEGPEIKNLSVAAINKTWQRLGLVRIKKPLFFTKWKNN